MKKNYFLTLLTVLITSLSFGQVFITEIADPNNDSRLRYIELYNAGNTAVDLSTGWKMEKYTNASATVSATVNFTGTIPSKGFYILARGTMDNDHKDTWGFTADQWDETDTDADQVAGGNGDDNYKLFNGATLIDVFGVPGTDGTGTDHEFEDGRAERKSSVTTGNTTWTAAEWNIDSDIPSGDGAQNSTDKYDPRGWVGNSTTYVNFRRAGNTQITYSNAGPSVEFEYFISGVNLSGDIVITVPSDYEVSTTTGSGFGTSATYTPSSNVVAKASVFIRLKAGLSGGSYDGTATATSTGATNVDLALSGKVFGALTNSLTITAVYDGDMPKADNSGSTHAPKGIELYVINDIADLSNFGVGSANNGGGTDGQEFTFPAGAVSKGTYIYVANESPNFTTFMGFAPTHTSGSMGINGDDAIELFENGQVIDVFGDIDKDGTGEPWEYLDGWAYRNTAGPNTTFTHTEWNYSGKDALDGEATNAAAAKPIPVETYNNAVLSVVNNEIKGFSSYPNPVRNGKLTITSATSDVKNVAIYNVLGRKVFNETISGTSKQLNINSVTSGVYILKVIEGNKVSTKKLVVR